MGVWSPTEISSTKKAACLANHRQLQDNREDDTTTKPSFTPIWKRYFAFVVLLGYVIHSMANSVITVSLIDMTYNKIVTSGDETEIERAEFDWSSIKISMLMNAFWYGFLSYTRVGHLPRGIESFAIVGISLLLTGAITLLSPVIAHWGFYPFLISRVFVGLFEGFTSAGFADIVTRWAPKHEIPSYVKVLSVRSRIYVSVVIAYPLSGLFGKFCMEWSMTFYVVGSLCVVWSILWLMLVKNNLCADQEIQSIKKVTSPQKRDMLKSRAVWTVLMGVFAYNWGIAFTSAYLPFYISDASQGQRNIYEIAILASIPTIGAVVVPIIVIIIAGVLICHFLTRTQDANNVTPRWIGKAYISWSFLLAALLFVVIAVSDNFYASILCFFLIEALLRCSIELIDEFVVKMEPDHLDVMTELWLFWQTSGIIAAQTVVGYVVGNNQLHEWNVCFLLSTCVLLITAIGFMLLRSSELPQCFIDEKSISISDIECNQKNEKYVSAGKESAKNVIYR